LLAVLTEAWSQLVGVAFHEKNANRFEIVASSDIHVSGHHGAV